MIKLTLSVVLVLLVNLSRLSAQGPIDTIPQWNGTQFISSFGVPNTATYGQTITVAANSGPLLGFAFEIGFCTGPVTFRGHVYAFNGNTTTGASLFDSAPTTVPAGNTFTLVSFNANSLTLPPGTYMLFGSTSDDPQGNATCQWGAVPDASYAGGNFRFMNNGTNTALWATQNWSSISLDLAFQATFPGVSSAAPVPTLSEWAMILLACGLVFVAYRRLRAKGQPGPGVS